MRAFLFIAAAYAVTGLLTIPYLAWFPGVFLMHPSLGNEQVSVWLWIVWHFTFPVIIGTALLVDPGFNKRITERFRKFALRLTVAGTLAFAFVLTTGMFLGAQRLPRLVSHMHFMPAFGHITTPLAVSSFVLLAAIILRSPPRATLQYWLLIAVLTGALDATLNSFAPSRYSLSWYLGKIETLVTSGIVLVALLGQISLGYKKLLDMTLLDPLTGVRNRRGLSEMLQYTLDMGRRNNAPTGLLIIDIDHFKLYNDHYGHAAGDIALRMVAQALQSALTRSTDVVARYGGEEFVVILPATQHCSADQIAGRLRRAVESLTIPHAGSLSGPMLTVSVGVSGTLGRPALSGSELFRDADVALYEAKALGRNRVAIGPLSKSLPVAA